MLSWWPQSECSCLRQFSSKPPTSASWRYAVCSMFKLKIEFYLYTVCTPLHSPSNKHGTILRFQPSKCSNLGETWLARTLFFCQNGVFLGRRCHIVCKKLTILWSCTCHTSMQCISLIFFFTDYAIHGQPSISWIYILSLSDSASVSDWTYNDNGLVKSLDQRTRHCLSEDVTKKQLCMFVQDSITTSRFLS